jgi:nucleoid-associated protein YgaU
VSTSNLTRRYTITVNITNTYKFKDNKQATNNEQPTKYQLRFSQGVVLHSYTVSMTLHSAVATTTTTTTTATISSSSAIKFSARARHQQALRSTRAATAPQQRSASAAPAPPHAAQSATISPRPARSHQPQIRHTPTTASHSYGRPRQHVASHSQHRHQHVPYRALMQRKQNKCTNSISSTRSTCNASTHHVASRAQCRQHVSSHAQHRIDSSTCSADRDYRSASNSKQQRHSVSPGCARAQPLHQRLATGVPGIPQGSLLQYQDLAPSLITMDFLPVVADCCLFVHADGDVATSIHVIGILAAPSQQHADIFFKDLSATRTLTMARFASKPGATPASPTTSTQAAPP